MKLRALCWLTLPAFVALIAYAITTGQLRRVWSTVVQLEPLIEFPTKIDLGEQEIGDHAIGRLVIANRGGGELVLDQFQSNCSCAGLEEEHDGRYAPVKLLRLKAGEEAHLVVRVSVRGVPAGASMVNFVEFRTNDPTRPTARIEALVRRVFGGVSSSPASVVFGTVPVGIQVQHVVDIWDNALVSRTIERVTSSVPDRVTVRLLPTEGNPQASEKSPNGKLIGRLEVGVVTAKPGEVNAKVQIYIAKESRDPDSVCVIGRIAAPVEISPPFLILPRTSGSGPVFSAHCIFRSFPRSSLTLAVDPLPPGLTAEILSNKSPGQQLVQVVWDPSRGGPSVGSQRHVLRFRAKAGDTEIALELPVLLQR